MVDGDAGREQSEHRWREAQSVLDGVPDEGAQRRLKRQMNKRTGTAVGVLLVFVLVAVVYFALFGHRSGASAQPPSVPVWKQVFGLSLSVVGLAMETFGTVQVFRTRRFMRTSPTQVLARQERKQLLKEVRGQQPAVPTHLPLARDLARRLTIQSRLRFLMLGGWFIVVGQTVSINRPFNTFVAVGVTLIFALSTLLLTRDNKMAHRFLSQHPGPRAEESSLRA
jgi:hypothetical protein